MVSCVAYMRDFVYMCKNNWTYDGTIASAVAGM